MELMRVATFASIDQMVNQALRAQAVMNSEQEQESSGLVSSDYGGYGAQAGQVLNLQISLARSQSFSAAASAADERASIMSSALTSISDIVTSFRTDLTAATSTDGSSDGLQETASELLQEMASELNTQYEGEYVFGGSQTGSAPVNISDPSYAVATATSSADTSYYQGDDAVTSVRVSDEQVISYGVTADNPAFEQALRALNMIANSSDSTLDTDTLTAASNLISSALDDLTDVQSKLSADMNAMESAGNDQTDYQNFATTMVDDLTNVDVAAVTAKVTAYQTQLEASYAALSKIEDLNLADYLK
ncbi:MAG TPA: flagellin [Bradyrhizobium sp.]|nr:flagellin [Bradyrhizobium sp.]